MSSTLHAPFRADFVGSFLRPKALKEARAQFAEGRIGAQELKSVEDRLIKDLIEKEKAHGLQDITDGEFRRAYWHLDFMWGLEGVEHIELEHGYQFHDEETTKGSTRLTGKLGGKNHPFVEHFKYVKHQLIEDLASAYRQVIKDLYAAGCRNLQFDDCTWGMIIDDDYWKAMAGTGFTLEGEAERYLEVNNLALQDKPNDLVINTHICRGNYHSSWASKGAYDPVAPYVFAQENVDAFYLEYDDERSGSFEPLKYIPEDKQVVLGLITTKSPVLEDKEEVKRRIREAEKYVPLDRLCLSPQCGFASCEIGNKLTEAQQWAKIDLVTEIAKEVWG